MARSRSPRRRCFGFGPSTGRPYPTDGVMGLAFVSDDLSHHVGTVIRQEPDGGLVAELAGPADSAAAERQIRRILCVDQPSDGWIAAGRADPVLGAAQGAHPGLRPVLFHSPYEAAAWAMLAQRRRRSQAAALRRRLATAAGHSFVLAGQDEHAFPLPERLLALESFSGIDAVRMQRLHGVAQAALAGRLEPGRLAAMPAEAAMSDCGPSPAWARSTRAWFTCVPPALPTR
jgi:DNA-3-methyladenine glycosylase II